MKTFNRIFLTALFAGLLAGLALAGLQHYTVIPMILEAETYEVTDSDDAADHGEEEAWAPEDGTERTFYTATNSIIVGIGFGLLLSACYAIRRNIRWHHGILWGLAGFAAFHLAPSFGLPPELPGDAAAQLEQRQVWWVITVVLTAIGLWIIAFQPKSYLKLFGIALIALPHVFGAPQPEVHHGLAPEELRTSFKFASLGTNAIFWIVLGTLSAYFYVRIEDRSAIRSASETVS
ncbi:MAG: cobalt transporter [Gammaproteobacteria bacterium]|nr:MAG: cobalt transporter [Gammaproteobacteria bacterium]